MNTDTYQLETIRLILRPWRESDAEDLYDAAKDPAVGPIAGWPPHKSVEESREIIRKVLSHREDYAICLKTDGRAIGSISLRDHTQTDMTDREDECEMGYWLKQSFWGQGIMPEAVREILRHAFEDLQLNKVWIGYYEGNERSKRVQQKCGFVYQWTSEDVPVPQMHETRRGYVSVLCREDWKRPVYVTAAIIREENRIFATQRGYGDWKDYWEFPGGKIEKGETAEQALKREIREELDTEIMIQKEFATINYDYPSFHLTMVCFLAEVASGALVLKEHEAARWLTKEELDSVGWLPADWEIIEKLKQEI